MPLSGHDTGCNVWVENNELFIYAAQSGAFDEHGNMLKAGRFRLSFDSDLFSGSFSQELRLKSGDIVIHGKEAAINLWTDVFSGAVHIDIKASRKINVRCGYELWRPDDTVRISNGSILFYHRNTASNILNERLAEQGIEYLREYFPDVERNRTSGGIIIAKGMNAVENGSGRYINDDFTAYRLESALPELSFALTLYLLTAQSETEEAWETELNKRIAADLDASDAKERTLAWWRDFWRRSYVFVKPECGDPSDEDWQVGKNYQLFRYMQAANAYGEFPTKFNGGLFTVDAEAFVPGHKGNPDWRDWGGIMFTAQNQRLVYWPMIKNGDFDMMKPEFEFYKRLTEPIKKRTEHFFGLRDAACFCEQIDANGLSSHYGKYGVDYPLQVRHHYVEALEFCFMILKYHETSGQDISQYIDFIMSVINFYDYKYSSTDERGKRIIYPSTAMETYHAEPLTPVYGKAGVEAANYKDEETAVTNPADVIAALSDTIEYITKLDYIDYKTKDRLNKFKNELPDIPLEVKKGHTVIAPCEYPKKYYKGNCEIPQLNVVFPYNVYGINKPELSLARDTYYYAWDEEDQLSYISWHTNGVNAARIGLRDEAGKYMRLKLRDSGRKFPAFWGPGHDYTPDHNWGGSGMIGVQEMLLQDFGNTIYLLPAWNLDTDVCFKLWTHNFTYVDVKYIDKKFHISYHLVIRNTSLCFQKIFGQRIKETLINV